MFTSPSMAALARASANDGLSFREIVESLPTDLASVVTLVLVLGSLALVIWAGRPRGGRGGRPA